LVAGPTPAGPTFDTICLAQLIFSLRGLDLLLIMKYKPREERLAKLIREISSLSDNQLGSVEPVIQELSNPFLEKFNSPNSDLIDQCVLNIFGDAIRIHHCFSKGPFTKDKFEFALEYAFNQCGRKAKLAPPGIPGYDLVLEDKKYSLKTEAEKSIKQDLIHVSKHMELGKGEWNLELLRNQFLDNLQKTDRILTLRCLSRFFPYEYYELVEIPKDILLKSISGTLRLMTKSTQNPKPGYCDVSENGILLFQLYFDAGGERKLQIKSLLKSKCFVHAFWKFKKSSSGETNIQLPLQE
jgi:type II restriction enzyme